MKPGLFPTIACALLLAAVALAADKAADTRWTAPSAEQVSAIYPDVETLYLDLHRNPELSFQEQQTSAKLAERMRALGYEVTTGVGRTGVVAVLKNGAGPTVAVRTDMDALPVEEKTGVAYASHVTTKNATGETVPVMHACGHDIHMSSWFGTAKLLATNKQRWHGTVIFLGQPAEEIGQGAAAMLHDGLFTRFPKPDYVVGFHDDSGLPAGKVGYISGPAMASSDSVDITIFGRGGHGAMPQTTVDPVVISARTVLALQTIVSREIDPRDPAVITVGSIHGGTKHNIIPDEVRLQLTVRAYSEQVRRHLLASIERIAKGEALAAGAPREPEVKIEAGGLHATTNDPRLTARVADTLRRTVGADNVVEMPPKMVSEDFSEYGLAGVPASLFFVGGVEPHKYAAAMQSGATLPSLHSGLWAPDYAPTLKTGITAEAAVVLDLLAK